MFSSDEWYEKNKWGLLSLQKSLYFRAYFCQRLQHLVWVIFPDDVKWFMNNISSCTCTWTIYLNDLKYACTKLLNKVLFVCLFTANNVCVSLCVWIRFLPMRSRPLYARRENIVNLPLVRNFSPETCYLMVFLYVKVTSF